MTPYQLGERVQLHPATDHWMAGDRYAEVTGYTRSHNVRVRLERSGRTAVVHPDNLLSLRVQTIRTAVYRALRECESCALDDDTDFQRVYTTIMRELSSIGIRETERPPAPEQKS